MEKFFLRSLLRVFFIAIVLCNQLFRPFAVFACAPVKSAIVVEARNGRVIYSYNSDQKIQPASLAKMMTLLITFKCLQQGKLKLGTHVRISRHAAAQSPCKLDLKAGSTITVKDAIMSLITKSANDIAVALAEHIGGTEANFVRQMNREAARLGMRDTRFYNPSGWKDIRQLTTAKDMAILSRALLREYPGYYHLFATRQFCYNNKRIKNHNKLLGNRGGFVVDGIKTGYVTASGYNLAASARRGNTRLITVVLGGKNQKQRDHHTHLLFQKGFARLQRAGYIQKSAKYSKIAKLDAKTVKNASKTVRKSPKKNTAKIYAKSSRSGLQNFVQNNVAYTIPVGHQEKEFPVIIPTSLQNNFDQSNQSKWSSTQ